MSETMVST